MGVFINFSNHPIAKWSVEQKNAAMALAKCVTLKDLKFPKVPTDADTGEIEELAFEYVSLIRDLSGGEECYVMVQGEASLSCAVVQLLNNPVNDNLIPVCATSERLVKTMPDGSTKHWFEFVRFRRYCDM